MQNKINDKHSRKVGEEMMWTQSIKMSRSKRNKGEGQGGKMGRKRMKNKHINRKTTTRGDLARSGATHYKEETN